MAHQVPVITVVGWSNSGKTTFLTEVVRILNARGVRVGVVKHHGHAPDGVDVVGKDSWKYAHAGANPVVLSASSQYAIFRTVEQEATREELVAHIADEVDLVIAEGFREEADGAIELFREAAGHDTPKLAPEERIAAITDSEALAAEVRAEGKPVFGLTGFEGVADFILRKAGLA